MLIITVTNVFFTSHCCCLYFTQLFCLYISIFIFYSSIYHCILVVSCFVLHIMDSIHTTFVEQSTLIQQQMGQSQSQQHLLNVTCSCKGSL